MSGVPFRGVSANSDARFTDKERKLLKSMKFPEEYKQKVDLKKVKMEALKPWIAKRVTELLGIEDEVLVGYIYEQLDTQNLDPRILQINLTGFLEKNTSLFVKELWNLMVSATASETGIPQKLLEEAAAEKREREERQAKINEEQAKRQAERQEARRREEKEREEKRRQREKERQEQHEQERKRREKQRAEDEKEARERARRREEAYQKDRERERERERERRKQYEARLDEEHEQRLRARDRDREYEQKRKSRDDGPESHRNRALEAAKDSKMRTAQRSVSASPSPPPDSKRARGNTNGAEDERLGEPKMKKPKKEKKEKKEKKAKKEKKEKKEKRVKSESHSDDSHSEGSLENRRTLEDDLRRKALLSVKKE